METSETDAAPTLPALVVGSGNRAVKIGGRIDRIDVGQLGGQPVFAVVDYKTGATRSDTLDDIASGHALQLTLYTLAVIRLENRGSGSVTVAGGLLVHSQPGVRAGDQTTQTRRRKMPVLDAAKWDGREKSLDDIVPRLAAAMRGGQIPGRQRRPAVHRLLPVPHRLSRRTNPPTT